MELVVRRDGGRPFRFGAVVPSTTQRAVSGGDSGRDRQHRLAERPCRGPAHRDEQAGHGNDDFPAGELDLAGEQATRKAVAKALQRPPECLVLDLSGLSFIDSSGVHIAIELTRRSAAQNFRFVIVPGPRAVQRIFELCHLTDLLPFATQA